VARRLAFLTACAVASGLLLPAAAARAAAAPVLPAAPVPGWTLVTTGAGGGTVWVGRIPDRQVADQRPSAVYLPPHFDRARRYPVIYLLHGLPGSPSSYYDALRLATVADQVISSTREPFIVVVPVGGPPANAEYAEWAGVWEDFVVQDVVPWADRNLPTIPNRQMRALGGLCAGGYGAMNMGLRHPRLFGTLEAWEGYFAPVFRDGPFAHASSAVLAENDPTQLVRRRASLMRSLGTRFYVSVGGSHANIRRIWSLDFDALLARLRLIHRLWLLPAAERGHFWRATVPSALTFAATGFAAAKPPLDK